MNGFTCDVNSKASADGQQKQKDPKRGTLQGYLTRSRALLDNYKTRIPTRIGDDDKQVDADNEEWLYEVKGIDLGLDAFLKALRKLDGPKGSNPEDMLEEDEKRTYRKIKANIGECTRRGQEIKEGLGKKK